MPVTITLTEPLTEQLRARAKKRDLQVEDVVFNILNNALTGVSHDTLNPQEVVAKIKATPPNPQNIHSATSSLLEALRNAPNSLDFELKTWEKNWSKVEREIKTITRANNIAEGRE